MMSPSVAYYAISFQRGRSLQSAVQFCVDGKEKKAKAMKDETSSFFIFTVPELTTATAATNPLTPRKLLVYLYRRIVMVSIYFVLDFLSSIQLDCTHIITTHMMCSISFCSSISYLLS